MMIRDARYWFFQPKHSHVFFLVTTDQIIIIIIIILLDHTGTSLAYSLAYSSL